jgi:site-specific DNA-cytosine methylase
MVKTIEPKVFFIENAPTLTSLGLPILKNMVNILQNYKFLIINDCAKNHNVSMHRRRTFVIGYNNKYFNKIPKIQDEASEEITSEMCLSDVNLTYNKEFLKDSDTSLFKLYDKINPGSSIYRTFAESDCDIESLPKSIKGGVNTMRKKLKSGKNAWDKSPCRMRRDDKFPSLTSLTRLIHPIENRDLYIREYAHIMGYPDDFIFYQKECKTPIVQCIAQGVPVNFIRYISKEIKKSFNTNSFINGDIVYINQCNPKNIKIYEYSINEFNEVNKINEKIS